MATLIQQNTKLRETVEWVADNNEISGKVKNRCKEALEAVDDGQQSENQDALGESNNLSSSELWFNS